MSTHARLSPSSSKRWLTCPGSVKLIEALNLPNKSTRYAAEGTAAHEICERSLKEKKSPEQYLGGVVEVDGFKITVNQEMVDACKVYCDFVTDQLYGVYGASLRIEERCSLTSLGVPGLDGGTSDAVIIAPEEKRMLILDFKYGSGVAVEVEDNPQLMQYGLGALLNLVSNFDGWRVVLGIVQPRAYHADGPIRLKYMSAHDLHAWSNNVLVPGAKLCHSDEVPLIPSVEGCRFCPVNNCKARYDLTVESAMLDFSDDTPVKNVTELTAEQKLNVLKNIDIIRGFLKAVESQVHQEISTGSTDYVGEFKLVMGRPGNRKFDELAFDPAFSPLYDYLNHEDLHVEKQKTVTEVEKSLKAAIKAKGNSKESVKIAKEILKEVTVRPTASKIVVPIHDKRKEVLPDCKSDFEDM